MSVSTQQSPSQGRFIKGDFRTVQHNKTWTQFKCLEQGFENARGVRLFYYKGTIEILMPGAPHELFKGVIGFLIEMFLFHHETEFKPIGSATQEIEGIVSEEADESYEIQGFKLSIKIDFTNCSRLKLDRYTVLAVHEVWVWEDGVLEVYGLQSDGYVKAERSQIPALAMIDLALLSECILIGEISRLQAGKKLLKNS